MKTRVFNFLLFLIGALGLVGCQDNVDQSNMYTFVGKLMSDYISDDETLTHYAYLTKKVKLSSLSESTVYDLLSARGNFTSFAPTNDAVQAYLDSLYNTQNYDITQCPDSTAEFIVNNSLIDNKNAEALLTTGFEEGTIETQSFAGRFVTVNFDTITGGRAAIYIDKYSRIIASDIEVQNGVVHKVEKVVAPTTSTLSSLIEATPNLQVFSNLLKLTGYAEVMSASFRDMYYEKNHDETGPGTSTQGSAPVPCPAHRDFGYTAFVETDSVFAEKLGLKIVMENGQIANWDEVFAAIEQKCKEFYPNATDPDYASDENAVHQFVGYHLTDRSIPYNYINIHYNEQGYGYRNPTVLSIDTWCYYPTLTQNRLMKIMEGRDIDGKRINRYVSERNPRNYAALVVPREGILLHNEGENAALNGYFYTIDDILVYDDDVPNKVLNERLRFDISDLLPEQMSSGFRRITSGDAVKGLHIPHGYFENLTATAESNVVYLCGYGSTWENYQGDEYNIAGQYDVTLKLPHVPYYGTYEFRLGIQAVAARGMCQVYFGTNKDNLEAIGLPVDMRIYGASPVIGWEQDSDDEDVNTEVEKRMRLHGYLKAPRYYGNASASAVTSNLRNNERVYRKVLYTGTLDPKKTYYIRLKSVLENTATQLFLDYIEYVPKSVYNGAVEEDKW